MTQFFIVLKACSHSICVHCMRLLNVQFRSIGYHIYVFFFLKISSSVLKIYPVLLFSEEAISEAALCRSSTK